MLKYFINIFICLICFSGLAQAEKNNKDAVVYKEKYGLRVGVDLSKPVLSLFEEDYTGIEFVADYRLKHKLFLAAELGNEERTDTEGIGNAALYNYTTSGNYLKLGFDHNTYTNWYGEQNFITIGGRLSFSSFKQTLNSFNIFNSNRFFSDSFTEIATSPEEFDDRTAAWVEFVVGFKTEIFNNVYMGLSGRIGLLLHQNDQERFPNLWIPGFNKVTDNSNFGLSYNYSISYFIPFYKKDKKKSIKEKK